jgi:hypothetical protein
MAYTHVRPSQDRPYRINSISTLKAKNDPTPTPQDYEVSSIIALNTCEGDGSSRVRVALDNGQYFVLKVPEEMDCRFHEITSNGSWRLYAKFSPHSGAESLTAGLSSEEDEATTSCASFRGSPTLTYESALSKGNALILLYSLVQSICRRPDLFSGKFSKPLDSSPPTTSFSTSIDFYLCCLGMTALYMFYLVARSRFSSANDNNFKSKSTHCRLTLKSIQLEGGPGDAQSPAVKAISNHSNNNQPLEQAVEASKLPPASTKIPPPSTWIHSPLLIRCSPLTPHKIDGIECTPTSQLRVNKIPIPFETSLFKGVAMIRIANLPDSPPSYFKGRNRKMQVAIQGSFKNRTAYDKVFSGQEFTKKIPSLPSKSVVDTVFALLSSKLPPTFLQDVFADEPYFLSPLVNTCQGFAVERKGEEQDVYGSEGNKWAVTENTELLGPEVPKNGDKRRKFFASKKNLEKYYFDPELVYTFDYYQHYMDMNSMKFVVTSFLQFDVSSILGKQPMQLSMAKNMETKGYFWNFEVWHKAIVDMENDAMKETKEK